MDTDTAGQTASPIEVISGVNSPYVLIIPENSSKSLEAAALRLQNVIFEHIVGTFLMVGKYVKDEGNFAQNRDGSLA